jgi:uncharacterized protein YcbX
MPRLVHIQIFPIKALDPVSVESARVLRAGALEFDRRWKLVDAAGKVINGKRTAQVHSLRATYDNRFERVTFAHRGREASFDLAKDVEPIESWLGEVFSQPVRLLENPSSGFPDDTESSGPTVISAATLETVASWFPPLALDDTRWRFRANLEIGDVEPFWEDRLYGRAGVDVEFRIGDVVFAGTNPCQRCPVPTRDPMTGEARPNFTPEFTRQREATLPAWAEPTRFNHYYRLAVNTNLIGTGGTIRIGDSVTLVNAEAGERI